jgi:photosystem II stability/assembly factor-like uncharacterized protein
MARIKSPQRRLRPAPHPLARKRPSPKARRPVGLLIGAAVIAVGAMVLWMNRSDAPTSGSAPFVGGDLHSFVAVPGADPVLFAGGHEAVSVSTDDGRTWSAVESLQDADAMGWAFLDGSIWVGGHPGLEISTDGGQSFQPRNDGLPATDIHALGGSDSVLYAASPAAGFLASTDEGATWEIRNPGVGQSFMGAILVDPSDPDRVVAPDMSAGAVETTDGGRTWRVLGGVAGAMWISWDPADTERIIVSATGVATLTEDGGATWSSLEVPTDVSIVQIEPDDPNTWYAAAWSQDGTVDVSTSTDGGETWTPL